MTVLGAPAEVLQLKWWQRLLMPDLAAVAALVVLYLAVAVWGQQSLLNDSDTGWHIVTGERILATCQLPRADPYSFSKAGEPWFAWEWLADVIFGAAHKRLGLAGVVCLTSLALAATAWIWCLFTLRLGGNLLVTAALMIVVVASSTIHWHARPHVFSWSLLISWLWLLEKTPSTLSVRRATGMFLLMAAWANLHGSFFLGFFLAAAYIVQFWLEDRRRAVTAILESSAALCATLVNPYGWRLHLHLVRYLTNSDMLRQISEFQSPDFHGGGIYLAPLFFIAIAGAALCLEQRKYARALVLTLFVAIALRSARGIPVVAFAALPLAAEPLTRALSSWKTLCEWFRESGNFERVERECNGGALLLAALIMTLGWFSTPPARAAVQFPEERFPVSAAHQIARLGPEARIFAPDQYGGYLIYRFGGTRKVFFDGRSDFYGAQFVNDYVGILLLKPGWKEKFSRFRFTHAVLPENHALREALECAGWRRIYADKTAVLLERPLTPPAAPVCAMP